MATFKLPKIEVDQVIILDTPAAADATLATGNITIKDEAGVNALSFRLVSDGISYEKTAYAAGTKSVKRIDVPAPVNDAIYSITVALPNRQDFFLVGKESNAIVPLRTYSVSTDATATAAELKNAFVAAINADPQSGIVAASVDTDSFSVTLADVNSGDSIITVPSGFAVVVTTPYVAPSGTYAEAVLYSNAATAGANYCKYVLRYRKAVRHNAISGLKAIKDAVVIVFAEETAGTYAAFDTALTDILDAVIDDTSATTVAAGIADYLSL